MWAGLLFGWLVLGGCQCLPGLDFILRPTVRSPRSISRRRLELAQHPNWTASPLQLAEGLLTWKDDLRAGPLQVCRLGRGFAKRA